LEGVVRALATTAARGRAERPLISLFRSLVADTDRIALLKWTIGNTLSVLDQDALGEELLAIAADRSHGTSRQMIVAGLQHLGTPDPTSTLIDLLEDETVNGHAAVALGQRRSERALQHLGAFAERERGWKRRNALTAIRRIGKGAKTSKPSRPSKDGDGS
jgi:HEAT repeat protein